MKFSELVEFLNHRQEMGEAPSPDATVMAMMPDATLMTLESIQIEDHEEGGQTIWLHVEEF
jgi:hypothetical protein